MKYVHLFIVVLLLFSNTYKVLGQGKSPSVPQKSNKNNYSNNQILTNSDWYHTESHKKVVYNKAVNGLILINRYDGVLECYNNDYEKLWSFRPKDTLRLSNGRNQLFFNDGVIYTAYMTGYVYALDATNGKPFWESKIGVDKEVLHFTSQSLMPTNNKLFLTSRSNQNTYAIDATTGSMEWIYELSSPNSYLPYLAVNKNVYISSDPLLNVFEAASGKLLLQRNFNQNFGKLVSNGKLIITSIEQEKSIVALGAEDLSRVWDFRLMGSYYHVNKKILMDNNRLYFATLSTKDNSALYCLNADNGTLLWEQQIQGDIDYMERLGHTIYGYTKNKVLFFVSLDTPELKMLELQYTPVSNLEKKQNNIYFYAKEGLVKYNLDSNKEEIVIAFDGSKLDSRLDAQIMFVQ